MREREIYVECQAAGCASVLQVVVPPTHRQGNGEVLVRCGKCHRLLRVQLPRELLESAAAPAMADPATRLAHLQQPPQEGALPPQRHPDAIPHTPDQSTAPGLVPRRRRAPSAYQEFIGQEMKRLKATHPELDHAAAFKLAASSWATSGVKATAEQAMSEQQLAPASEQHSNITAEQQVAAHLHAQHAAQQQEHSGSSEHAPPTAPAPDSSPTRTASRHAAAAAAGQQQALELQQQQQLPQPAAVSFSVQEGANAAQPSAAPVPASMLPPAARGASTSSGAVNSHQSAATAPSVDLQPGTTPHTGSTADGLLQSSCGVSSGSMDHVTSAPLTLQQTWETLCSQHAPETMAGTGAAEGPSTGTAILQQLQQHLPPASARTAFAAGPSRPPVTTDLGPAHTSLKESPRGPAAAAAVTTVLSDGSDLASWSSGMTPGQAGNTAADPVLASPGALSGSAAVSMPHILRHNSAPITTAVAYVPRQSNAVGYSITTAGPSKNAGA